MNKTDAYNEFDPTQSQGACGCSGVGFDIETLTWKERKAPPPTDPCAEVKAQLAQAEADKAQAETDLAQAEADKAQAETDLAQAQADKAQAETDLAQAEADKAQAETDLAQAQADKSTVEAKLAETQAKLDECEASKCPEAKVISLGGETVFTGTSCDTMTGLGGDVVTGTEDVATPDPLGSETSATLERDP